MNYEFRDMDGTILEVGDTVVITENCLYVPSLYRGKVFRIDEFEIVIATESNSHISIQDERQVLYLFS